MSCRMGDLQEFRRLLGENERPNKDAGPESISLARVGAGPTDGVIPGRLVGAALSDAG
jgi:hypothetical protein